MRVNAVWQVNINKWLWHGANHLYSEAVPAPINLGAKNEMQFLYYLFLSLLGLILLSFLHLFFSVLFNSCHFLLESHICRWFSSCQPPFSFFLSSLLTLQYFYFSAFFLPLLPPPLSGFLLPICIFPFSNSLSSKNNHFTPIQQR